MVYDLIVIGGGPGGYLAAERAGHAGLQTLLIEKEHLGGVCLNEGCIPSKAFLYCAKAYEYAAHGQMYGVTASQVSYHHDQVVERKNKVVKTLVSGVRGALKANHVTVVEGCAKICGRNADGYTVQVEEQSYTAKRLIIATGSSAVVPPIDGVREGLQNGFVLTNKEILDLDTLPKELVVIGGGVIGLEMASYFQSVGTQVTVIEMLDKIAGPADRDISEILMKNYKAKGIQFYLQSKVVRVEKDAVVYEKDGTTQSVKADKVLLSIGRRANIVDIGLETIGVETERTGIKTDWYCRTNIPNVYAIGDVNGKIMLAHTAYREAEVAVNHILGKKDTMRYHAIPSVIYTNPEVAFVGETEKSATEKGIDFEVVTLTMKYSGRYVAENLGGTDDGICKLLMDKKHRNIIGVHMICNYASEIIYGAAMMVESEMRVEELRELVFPHPTVAEIIREGLFQFK